MVINKKEVIFLNRDNISLFEKLLTQLEGLYNEVALLSKKKPDDAINLFKLKFINKVLLEVNVLLGEKYKPFQDFELFEEDTIPTNSDVVMILSQYLNCMEEMRSENITGAFGYWYWIIDGKESNIQTAHPKKIRQK